MRFLPKVCQTLQPSTGRTMATVPPTASGGSRMAPVTALPVVLAPAQLSLAAIMAPVTMQADW